jgi:hypothetical protein
VGFFAGRGNVENFNMDGPRIFDRPLTIDHHLSLLDTASCETFTEAIVADKTAPYALGTRLRVPNSAPPKSRHVSTTGVGFNADHYLKTAQSED